MIGKVSTTDKEEAERTGKEYLDPEFFKNIPSKLIIPKRCKWCRDTLHYKSSKKYFRLGYCSEWCYEIEHPPKLHVCKECGIVVEPFKNKKTGCSSGTYPKYCEEHKYIWLKNKKPRKIKYVIKDYQE